MTEQDPHPPDLRLMVLALILLLSDIDRELEDADTVLLDTRLRLRAMRAVLDRFRDLNL